MDDTLRPNAKASLANGASSSNHHRRRSSITPRRVLRRENTNDVGVASGSEEDMSPSPASVNEIVAMDDIPSDGIDEEAGLTSKERRRHARIHSHSSDQVPLSSYEKRLADRDVLKKLVVNALLIGGWYFFATSISVYNKWMFAPDRLDFHYPLFTTSLHMLVQFTLSCIVLYIFPRLRPSNQTASYHHLHDDSSSSEPPTTPTVTTNFYATRLLPCGAATALDIGLGNTSLKFISLTFLTMCKSSALAFVLLFAFVFKLETPSWKLILIIATMTVGVVMMVAGEAAFNAIGFALIISSAFFSGFRWALTQILLLRHPVTANPFSTIFYISPIMFVCLLLLAAFAEGPIAIVDGLHTLFLKEGVLQGICLLLFPGILAFCMISSEFALLQRTNVVTLSICGIFKEVVTISAAEIVYHDPLTPINISGLLVTIASIAGYNYLKVSQMREDAKKGIVAGKKMGKHRQADHDHQQHGDVGADDGTGERTTLFAAEEDEDLHHQRHRGDEDEDVVDGLDRAEEAQRLIRDDGHDAHR